jgi:hypothetical protein
MTIHMNGCDFVAHIGQTTGGGNTYGVTYDIVCQSNQEITETIWTTDHEHTTGLAPFCVIHIGPQSNRPGGHVRDTTNGTLDLNGPIENISVTRTNNTGPADTHTVLCPETTLNTAKIDIDATVKGVNGAGGATEIGISEL